MLLIIALAITFINCRNTGINSLGRDDVEYCLRNSGVAPFAVILFYRNVEIAMQAFWLKITMGVYLYVWYLYVWHGG